MNTKLRAALPMLLDIVIPIAGYYVLSACGLDDFWALTIAGLATAMNAIVGTTRRRRLDAIGALVVLEIAPLLGPGSPGSCVLLGQLPGLVAVVAGIVFTRLRVPSMGHHLGEQMVNGPVR